MTRRRIWALAAFGVGGLAVFWHMAAAYGARARTLGDEEPPAESKVVRASAFVLEDADGVERGRLALDGDEMVLEAFGDGEEAGLQLRFLLDEHAPRLTVSSPPQGSIITMAVGEVGGQPWLGLRRSKESMNPNVYVGLQSMGPMIALNDEDGPRICLSSFLHNPGLFLYDDEGEMFWHTPEVPGRDHKYGAALEEEKRRAAETAVEEIRMALEVEKQEREDMMRAEPEQAEDAAEQAD